MPVGPMTIGMIKQMNKEDTILLYSQLVLDNQAIGLQEVHEHLIEIVKPDDPDWSPYKGMWSIAKNGGNLQDIKSNLDWQIYMLNPDECALCGEIIVGEPVIYAGEKFCSNECVREMCMDNSDAMNAYHPFR